MVTAVALVALAVVGGQPRQVPTPNPTQFVVVPPTAPPPTISATPTASTPTPAPSPAATGAWIPLYMRSDGDGGADLFAALPDGTETLVRHLPAITLDQADTTLVEDRWDVSEDGTVSSTGWLAVQVDPGAYAFFEIGDPQRLPWVIDYWAVAAGAWSPSGMFAVIASTADRSPGGTLFIDPVAHAVTRSMTVAGMGGGPTLYWAADNSGVLTQSASVLRADGSGTASSPRLPQIADRRGGRPFAADSTFLCGRFGVAFQDGGCPDDALATKPFNGRGTEWSDLETASGTLLDASFAADGQRLWALAADESAQSPVTLLLFDEPGASHVVATIDRSVFTGADAADLAVGFGDLAPDDTTILISYLDGLSGQWRFLTLHSLVEGSAVVHAYEGVAAGFVPSSTLESWLSAD